MDYVQFKLEHGFYFSTKSSSDPMCVLGMFLSNIGCSPNGRSIFQDWAIADKNDPNGMFTHICGTNATLLDEDDEGDIHIIDNTGSDDDDYFYIPAKIKLTQPQFVQLLDDWQEKVCKPRPQQVIIKHENDQFSIETTL